MGVGAPMQQQAAGLEPCRAGHSVGWCWAHIHTGGAVSANGTQERDVQGGPR